MTVTEIPGRHAAPLDGAVTANGHQLAPFTATPLQTLGPVSALPRQQDDKPARRAVDGDTVIRVLAAAVVLAVAAFAAIVSYSHIFELGRAHGQDGAAARLLPLSVDGLIASASLVMLYAARNGIALRRVSWPRVMLWLGIGATVTANVGYGLPFGWLAAVVSAWPAVAFVGSVEMAVRFVRDARQDDSRGDDTLHVERPTRLAGGKTYCACGRPWPCPHAEVPGVPAVTPRRDGDDDKSDKPAAHRAAPALTRRARAAIVIRDNPGLTNSALAGLAGCDVSTISRAKRDVAKGSKP